MQLETKHLFGIIAMLLCCGVAQAQTVKGKILDENKQPMGYANVVALTQGDSAFVTGVMTGNDGTFSFDAKGGKILRISSLGYKTLYMSTSDQDLQVTMTPEPSMLGEVVVKSQMPKTQLKDGGMVTHITGTILERAGTAEQLLNRLPSLTAKDGNVEVLGRGTPIIYINGRRMREQGELTRLSSEDIKSVEVITNPGARYEASATSVVRITTKPKAGDGFGIYSQSWIAYEESGLWRGIESLSMNYRDNGLDLGGALYYNQYSRHDDKDITTYTFLEKNWRNSQTVRQRYNGKNFFAKLRASYAFNDSNSIGLSFSYDRYPEIPCVGNITAMLYENEILNDNTVSIYKSDEQKTALNGNAYYVGKIGTVGIDFNTDWYDGKNNEWMRTNETDGDINTDTHTHNQLLASKLILTVPLWGGELSFGGEYSYSKRTTRYSVLPKDLIDDDDSRIEEGMASGFAEYSHKFGSLSLRAGLRYEYVDFDYYDHDIRIAEQSRTFSDLFPSLALSMPVGHTQMMLTYSSDVARPSYWILRSNITYGNRYTYETGNPFLVPQVRSNLEYTLSYKWFTYSAMFSHMKHPLMGWGDVYKNQPNVMISSFINGDSYNLVYTKASISPTIGIWTPMLSAALMKQWIHMTTFDGHSLNNPKATFRFNNTLETKLCDITLSMFFQTEGGDINEYFREGLFNMDLSLRRALLKNRLTLQLDFDGLVHPVDRTVRIYYGSIQGIDFKNIHQRMISLTVRYNFNTTRSKYRGTGAGQSQKSRM